MQENEFEKKIREKMDELQLVPAEDVWKRVSANIHQEKRRRRFLFFLLTFTFLAGVIGLYLFINSNKIQRSFISENNTTSSGNSPHKNQAASQSDSSNKDETASRPNLLNEDETNSQGNSSNKNHTDLILDRYQTQGSSLSSKSSKMVGGNEVEGTKKKELLAGFNKRSYVYERGAGTETKSGSFEGAVLQDKKPEAKKTSALNNRETSTPMAKPSSEQSPQGNSANQLDNINSSSKKDSVVDKPPVKALRDTTKPTVAEGKQNGKIKVRSAKKWTLGFTVFSGISNNLSHLTLFPVANTNYANSPAQSSTATGSLPINKLSYQSGFSYGVGIYLQKALTKSFSFSAGLNYHFETATSLVGNRNSSPQTFYDAGLQNSSTVNEFYGNGQSVNYRNKYYLIEAPLNLSLRLNKNANKQLLLTAGISPAYLLSSKALYTNSNQNVYYASKEQFKKWVLSGQTGIQFTVANAPRFNINAGPEFQYGLNNMAKSATGTDQHLGSVALKVSITLK